MVSPPINRRCRVRKAADRILPEAWRHDLRSRSGLGEGRPVSFYPMKPITIDPGGARQSYVPLGAGYVVITRWSVGRKRTLWTAGRLYVLPGAR